MLIAFYRADQKEGHTTFLRYLKEMTFHPNLMVQRLMGMGEHLGIGATKAEALIGRFGTVYNVATATPEMLAAVEWTSDKGRKQRLGEAAAIKFLRGVGRPDV
jgi:ERCC4-type nuclease